MRGHAHYIYYYYYYFIISLNILVTMHEMIFRRPGTKPCCSDELIIVATGSAI